MLPFAMMTSPFVSVPAPTLVPSSSIFRTELALVVLVLVLVFGLAPGCE